MKPRILVVDDEQDIRELLKFYLNKEGYEVIEAANGEEALTIFENEYIDLGTIDVMMPKMDGFELVESMKEFKDVPCIMLTAKGESKDKLRGFSSGVDDYVVKPFSPKELEARVKTILRRTTNREIAPSTGKVTKNVITTGNIKIDTARRQVFRKNERIRLTGMEFSLLELLVNNSGQAYSRNEILQYVWAYPPDHRIDTRVVDVHISRLRSKLETDPANPELILTARGIGYMFQRIS